MADINELRREIDAADKEITKLFLHRMEVCRDIGEYKAKRNLPVLDVEREKQLLEAKAKGMKSPDRENVERLFKCIMDISKDEQRKICKGQEGVVGFCGIEGAHGYFAAKSAGNTVRSFSSFHSVAAAVESGEIARGVLPIENTTSGSVLEVYDVLGESSLYIVGEIIMPVTHCLLGLGDMGDIKSACSHPQALAQCDGFLNSKGYKRIQSVNTAVAAKECKEKGDITSGVIASRMCGELYGLNILKEGIEDRKGNKTRFIVISRNREDSAAADKASITFTLPHRQGSLIEMLSHFKDVNLTKIESRPVGDFEYRFYLDFVADRPVDVLHRIMGIYNTIKVLGVYKGKTSL